MEIVRTRWASVLQYWKIKVLCIWYAHESVYESGSSDFELNYSSQILRSRLKHEQLIPAQVKAISLQAVFKVIFLTG